MPKDEMQQRESFIFFKDDGGMERVVRGWWYDGEGFPDGGTLCVSGISYVDPEDHIFFPYTGYNFECLRSRHKYIPIPQLGCEKHVKEIINTTISRAGDKIPYIVFNK